MVSNSEALVRGIVRDDAVPEDEEGGEVSDALAPSDEDALARSDEDLGVSPTKGKRKADALEMSPASVLKKQKVTKKSGVAVKKEKGAKAGVSQPIHEAEDE